MSRAIKFRAWDGECYWYEIMPSPIRSRTVDICAEITDYEPEYSNMVHIVNNVEAIEQYTGLEDKNGKEIYEGDIVSELVGDYRYSTAIKGVIEQHKGSWAIRWGDTRNGYSQLYYEQTVCEIIGNIHENPELIGGEDA